MSVLHRWTKIVVITLGGAPTAGEASELMLLDPQKGIPQSQLVIKNLFPLTSPLTPLKKPITSQETWKQWLKKVCPQWKNYAVLGVGLLLTGVGIWGYRRYVASSWKGKFETHLQKAKENLATAVHLCEAAANQGDPQSWTRLGYLCDNVFVTESPLSLFFKTHEDPAFYFSQKAAEAGDEQGFVNRAILFFRNKEFFRARRDFEQAASRGHAVAQNYMGYFYEKGEGGVSRDYKKAAEYYQLAALQGERFAQYNLGLLYEYGLGGLPKNMDKAMAYFKQAAEQKVEEAIEKVLENQKSSLQAGDPKALDYYTAAAQEGSPFAQYTLGMLYETGIKSIQKDTKKAINYFIQAANQGFDEATQKLIELAPEREEKKTKRILS